jgi:hypothetical protein
MTSVRIETLIEAGLPTLHGDRGQLEQVILNLVNASWRRPGVGLIPRGFFLVRPMLQAPGKLPARMGKQDAPLARISHRSSIVVSANIVLLSGTLTSSIAPRLSSARNEDPQPHYVVVGVDFVRYQEHRLIWKVVKGVEPPLYIDHIDGDRGNNRIENLRAATSSQNAFHGKVSSRNTSGIVGVYLDIRPGKADRWRAYISVHRRQIKLGSFGTIEGGCCGAPSCGNGIPRRGSAHCGSDWGASCADRKGGLIECIRLHGLRPPTIG